MPVPPNPPEHSETRDYIREILARRPFLFTFPRALEKEFLETRVESSLFYIRSGRWLLLFMFSVIVMVAWLFFQPLLVANDYQALKYIYFPVGAGIVLICFADRVPGMRRHFHQVMFPVSLLLIVLVQQHILMAQGSPYAAIATWNQMITLLLVALGLRFATPVLIGLYALSGLVGVGVGMALGFPFDGLHFFYYFVLYGLVVCGLAAIAERQERFGFLQERMVQFQSEELERLNRRLDKIAHEDALTGIANRRSFDTAAAIEWERAYREQQPLSLLLLDVDYFKRYNDTYGHDAGDTCLQEVAQALQEALMRPADLVARYGGEEFVLLLPNTHERGADKMAERIVRSVDNRRLEHSASAVASHVTVSVGVTTLIPQPGMTLREALKQADEALYHAKASGRHQFRTYPTEAPVAVAEASGQSAA